MNVTVAVIEDDNRYRGTLAQLFSHAAGFELGAEYSSPPPAIRAARRLAEAGDAVPWDVVLMDLEMPVMGGIEGTRRLKQVFPRLKIIVLTVFESPDMILEAICAGADGYMLKRARAPELLAGIRSVLAGGAPLTPNVARSVLGLVRERREATAAPGGKQPDRLALTEREQQVLRSLVEGLSYKQVGAALGISLGTVRTHITSIYRKLQVHSVAEAITRALRERLV